jgi:hypothetical protein
MKKIIILAFLAVMILGLGLILLERKEGTNLSFSPAGEKEQKAEEKVFLTINNGQGNPRESEFVFEEGITAFDLLDKYSKQQNLTLKTKSYDAGIFIEAIGSVENGQDGKYWMYYVNGQMPMVAADKQELTEGDKVEFKFETSNF